MGNAEYVDTGSEGVRLVWRVGDKFDCETCSVNVIFIVNRLWLGL